MSNTPTNIQQTRKHIEQLRHEASITRIPISQAAESLKNFCESNIRDDPLVVGVSASLNPFKDKTKCSVL